MRVKIEDAARVMNVDPSVIYRKVNIIREHFTKRNKYIDIRLLAEILLSDSYMLAELARRKPKTDAEQKLKDLLIKSCEG